MSEETKKASEKNLNLIRNKMRIAINPYKTIGGLQECGSAAHKHV